MTDRTDRMYGINQLPTLQSKAPLDDDGRELLLKIYEQTCSTWRALVDVRFKLLALVPTASLIGLATLLGLSNAPTGSQTPFFPRLSFSVLGFISALGLWVYDNRNSILHDDLVSRGRRIEDELGVDTAKFRGR